MTAEKVSIRQIPRDFPKCMSVRGVATFCLDLVIYFLDFINRMDENLRFSFCLPNPGLASVNIVNCTSSFHPHVRRNL